MPLLIPVPAVQELTSEEIEPFKDALLAFLRGRNAEIHQQVDSHLHITRGERVPAYVFRLHVLLETRDAKPDKVVKPFTPDDAKLVPTAETPPPEIPKNLAEAWNFPTEERPDFKAHTGTYFLPGSIRVEGCRECYERGEAACKPCLGKGEESCPTCLGAGNQPCLYCKGLEKISCLRCSGEGRLAAGGVGGRSARCDACGGSGKFPCTHCREGKTPCTQCRGGGKASCHKCNGAGKIVCGGCQGQKKVISGTAFHAEFKPFQAQSAALVSPAPSEALDLATKTTTQVGSLTLQANESFEAQVKAAEIPVTLRAALMQLVEREKGQLTVATRAVKHRLDLLEGSVVRVSGYCSGQEFAFWMLPGNNAIVTEKDPLISLGASVAEAAEEAQASGDWKKALDLAHETLTYAPDHIGALEIRSGWRRKVTGEALIAGLLGGALAVAAHAYWILNVEPGVHRARALMQVSGLQLVVGVAVALALVPALLHFYRFFLRGSVLGGTLLFAFLFTHFLTRWAFEWRPVAAADARALETELKDHFKHGVPMIYHEPDLRFLQSLSAKYRTSDIDKSRLKGALDHQLELRDRFVLQQQELDDKVGQILASEVSNQKKRAQLTAVRESYRMIAVDLTKLEAALAQLEQVVARRAEKRKPSAERISVRSARSGTKSGSSSKTTVRSSKKPAAKTTTKTTKKAQTPAPKKSNWWE